MVFIQIKIWKCHTYILIELSNTSKQRKSEYKNFIKKKKPIKYKFSYYT